jgi:cyclic pyranopterin phosphate synthase
MELEPLQDGHGRLIGDLRVSVTDRCNFRCQYCMPAEGLPWLERAEVLTFEEITRLVSLFAAMGVGELRLTGGEPLVRRHFPALVAMLRGVEDLREISVTTNGFLLERDAAALVAAGVDRFNVSVDSLQRDRFYALTRRDALEQVLVGLRTLAGFPEAHPIKVNAVAIRGFTELEVLPFAALARSTDYEVRFIEFMPLDADRAWTRDQVLTGAEIRAAIEDASRARPHASFASPTAPVGSASSTRSPSRSAQTATACASPRTAGCARACSHCTKRTCADHCATAPTTLSSCGSSVTRSGARSSSTTSASLDSSSRRGRCRRSAAEPAGGVPVRGHRRFMKTQHRSRMMCAQWSFL